MKLVRHLNKQTKKAIRKVMAELNITSLTSDDDISEILVRLEEMGKLPDYETVFQDVQRFVDEVVMDEE